MALVLLAASPRQVTGTPTVAPTPVPECGSPHSHLRLRAPNANGPPAPPPATRHPAAADFAAAGARSVVRILQCSVAGQPQRQHRWLLPNLKDSDHPRGDVAKLPHVRWRFCCRHPAPPPIARCAHVITKCRHRTRHPPPARKQLPSPSAPASRHTSRAPLLANSRRAATGNAPAATAKGRQTK